LSNYHNALIDFSSELTSSGLNVKGEPVVNGEIHRVPELGSKKAGDLAGWYIAFSTNNGHIHARFGSWRSGNSEKWSSISRNKYSPDDRAAIKRITDTMNIERGRNQAVVAKQAASEITHASPADEDHPYLTKKGIKPCGAKQQGSKLLIPLSDIEGNICSYQTIAPSGKKLLKKGGAKKERFFQIGEVDTKIYIAEGFATAASIHEATGEAAFMAVDAGNIEAVAKKLRKKHKQPIIIAADNDQWTDGNPGLSKAKKVTEIVSDASYVSPDFTDIETKPTDFNDLHVLEGLDVARSQLSNTISPIAFDDCISAAAELSDESSPDDISGVLELAHDAKLNAIENRQLLNTIKLATKMPLSDLRKGMNEIRRENSGPSEDLAYEVAEKTLNKFYAKGDHLIRSIDKSFWKYNGKHWHRYTDEQVQNRLLEVIKKEVDPENATFASTMRAALALIISKQAADGDVLRLAEEPLPVINCQNGELWIDQNGNAELRPHRHDSNLTYALDVTYDPSATCPRFDQALPDIFAGSSNPTDMSRHFQEFMGYAIQPKRDIAAFFILRGKGRNGKTKLMETLERLMNKRAIYSDRMANIEQNKFAIGALVGKLLLIDDDVDTGTKLPDGFLKKVSERKLMTGELKFKDSFEFICTALPVLLANNYPYAADLSWGLRRRAHIIPFERVFTAEDADDTLFPNIWESELPGVLNRAIEGLFRLRQRGAFKQPIDCVSAHDAWLTQANPLSSFIKEECQELLSGYTLLSKFYSEFEYWAKNAGIRNIASRNTIKSNLENLGYEVRHRKNGNAVYGLEIAGVY
jgi:P4 family phage/plasmid primase-like protien